MSLLLSQLPSVLCACVTKWLSLCALAPPPVADCSSVLLTKLVMGVGKLESYLLSGPASDIGNPVYLYFEGKAFSALLPLCPLSVVSKLPCITHEVGFGQRLLLLPMAGDLY